MSSPGAVMIQRLFFFTRDLYRQTWPGFAKLSGTGRAAVGMETRVFRAYLDVLKRRDFDSVTKAVKPMGLARGWALVTG